MTGVQTCALPISVAVAWRGDVERAGAVGAGDRRGRIVSGTSAPIRHGGNLLAAVRVAAAPAARASRALPILGVAALALSAGFAGYAWRQAEDALATASRAGSDIAGFRPTVT